MSNTDAKLIGAQLQSLLKIPPIQKLEDGKTAEVGASASSLPTPRLSEDGSPVSHAKTDIQNLNTFQSMSKGVNEGQREKSIRTNDKKASAGNSRNKNDYHKQSSVQSGKRNQPQSDRSPDNKSNRNYNNNYGNKSENSSDTSPNSAHADGFDNKEHRVIESNIRDIKMDSPIRQLLAKAECPCDIKRIGDLIVDCSYKIDDGRTALSVHLDETVKTVLSNHYLDALTKKSAKFPKAKFYCNICNYHVDTIYSGINHVSQDRHVGIEKMKKLDFTLTNIPLPAHEHTAYLTELLVKVSKQYGMNQSEKAERVEVVSRLRNFIDDSGIVCTVTIFGSSASGFGFRDSDVNINVGLDPPTASHLINADASKSPTTANHATSEHAEILNRLIEVIREIPFCSQIKENFTPKVSAVHFIDTITRTNCKVHFSNTSAVFAAMLFSEYDKIDVRVRILATAFRYWARICEIDDQELGMLPSHCYTILVLHYLQQVGVVPVLHSFVKNDTERLFAQAEEAKILWKGHNNQSVGELWLGMLKYYSVEFNYKEHVVSISSQTTVRRNEKHWNRKLSIEDPILSRSNLSRSVSSNKVCDYILDRIKLTYMYFAIPRGKDGPLYDGIISDQQADTSAMFMSVKEISAPRCSDTLQDMVRRMQDLNVNRHGKSTTSSSLQSMGAEKGVYVEELEGQIVGRDSNVVRSRMVKVPNINGEPLNYIISKDAHLLHSVLYKREFIYEFQRDTFQNGAKPPVICKSCSGEGHVRKDCPEETIPPVRPVTMITPFSLQILTSVIVKNYEQETLNDHDLEIRQRILSELRNCLTPAFDGAELFMFGSTFNGFGLHFSDVDVCMTFRNHHPLPNESPLKNLDVNDILKKIVERLKAANCMQEILAIPSAKVPIVKFRHRASKLEGDISLYNTLAMHNTRLLRTYSDVDPRVKILGCVLKRLTKLCDISDASKGSLSSYGYVLMLIHFLQNHIVPVLPVLQELSPFMEMPVNVMEGCNVWFLNDLSRLPSVWSGYGKNQESISQLWLSFLIYYTEKFNFDEQVISISQIQPLTRLNKFWHTEAIAIEDPFDRTHNLGAGLSRRMSVHIIKTLQRFRDVFFVGIDSMPQNTNWLHFYMDLRRVRGGNPPIDRQCRLCNRIGHFARNCTYTTKGEDREAFSQDDEDFGGDGQFYPLEVISSKNSVPTEQFTSVPALPVQNEPLVEENVGMKPMFNTMDIGDIPLQQSKLESVMISPPVALVVPPQEDVYGQPIVPGLSFIGGDGNLNPEDSTIQSMIRNNSGVTFSLEKKKAEDELAAQNRQAEMYRQSAELYMGGSGMKPHHDMNQPRYMASRHFDSKESLDKRMIPEEYLGGQNVVPHMRVPNSRMIPNSPMSGSYIPQAQQGIFNGINQPPQQQQQQPQQQSHSIAPPPGFPPLPNSCVYSYNHGGVGMYNAEQQIHPMKVHRHHMYGTPPPPASEQQMMVNGGEDGMGQMSPSDHMYRGVFPDGSFPIMHMPPPVHNMAQYQLPNPEQNVIMSIPISMSLPNGIMQNNGLIMTSANSTSIMSIKSSPSVNMVQNDFDRSDVGHMMPGYHLSHVHQGAVVSALPMQHSQHHPIQMRPFPFRYGPMDGMSMPMHGPYPFSGGPIASNSHLINNDEMLEDRGQD